MIINDYGNYTKIFLQDFGSIEVDGHISPLLNSKYILPSGAEYSVKGYSHRRHNDIIHKHGDTQSLGWKVNEIIGIGIVNPTAIAIAKRIFPVQSLPPGALPVYYKSDK